MSIRVVLVPVFGSEADAASLNAAIGLVRRFDAHARTLFVRVDPMDVVPVIGEGISPAVIDQLTQAAKEETKRQHDAARASFDAACRAAGIALLDAPGGTGTASAAWSEIDGRRDVTIPRIARVSDLVVFGRPDDRSPADVGPALEATLFGAGRPLLLVPPSGAATVGHTVAIAWNGSTEATRALALALPLVDAAGSVHLLTAETRKTRFDVTLDLVQYLEWRGVACERHHVTAEGEPVGAALLRSAAEIGADLVIMGGYGRTRLSELVLGGVTRHMLAHAQLPVLLAH